jgi:hypothetical protein
VSYDFPSDLVDLQRRFFQLERQGEVTPELTDAAVRLNSHPWWTGEECGNRFEARMALRQLVQDEGNPSPPDSAG